ncbi:aminodeoxychorismate synthase, component I [Shouchella clausii]|uniref:aminodeoxychorismate synthase n=2 Tax=Shouchella clausii TaxID=79880 RepID=A0A268NUI0_SHOCL|nr:aminodeoxychorismate synthase, component I [Shouchella clausii]PAE86919.1 aminodeoxychorismate synthase, component I [Shouchella clausii]
MAQKGSAIRTSINKKIAMPQNEWFHRFSALAKDEPHHVLLESGQTGRYSIIGLTPVAVIEGKGHTLMVSDQNGKHLFKGPLLSSLETVLAPYQTEDTLTGPPMQGGAIGYLSYDVVREIESLKETAVDDLQLPEVYFLVFEEVAVYDHEEEQLWLCANGSDSQLLQEKVALLEQRWLQAESAPTPSRNPFTSRSRKEATFTKEQFVRAVERVQDYIRSGDVFQVNLSVRQTRSLQVDPFSVYKELRQLNPSPYMGYIHSPKTQIVSASPELLIKKRGNELETRPIAGTRSRGANEAEDAWLEAELLSNEKERAEHVMLVDLERNDLGRVSQYGTVAVDDLLVVERYSHVMHLVSSVKGQLAEGLTLYDCIRATFPGGTITGAPKVRTMEIIEELEPVRRGLYTGSIGWIGFNGDMELNIVIRTMLCQDGNAHVQAGAGIVIDSNAENEYKESMKKAQALWRALELAEQRVLTKTSRA